jgi:hypothetical protein
MDQAESTGVLEEKYTRRTFIEGVIATGAHNGRRGEGGCRPWGLFLEASVGARWVG